MTHTLHREGTEENLKDDFLLLVSMTEGINNEGASESMKKMAEIIFKIGPANYGCYEVKKNIFTGLTLEEVKKATEKRCRIRCVFDSKEKFKEVIRKIVSLNSGLSIAISGSLRELNKILKELNIKPHSINISMGTYGLIEKLPDKNIREITSMCGHGLLSPELVKDMIIKIIKGKISIKKASIELSKPCVCGIVNPDRTYKLLKKLVKNYDDKGDKILK